MGGSTNPVCPGSSCLLIVGPDTQPPPPPPHPSERDRVVEAGPGGVRLRHLQSLHGSLEEARRGDWAQDVCTKYRAPLPPDLQVRGGGGRRPMGCAWVWI